MAKALPRRRSSASELQNAIADVSGLPLKDVKCLLDALRDVAAKSLRDTSVFKLRDIVSIRMQTIPPRMAVMRRMFSGEEIIVPAKPAR